MEERYSRFCLCLDDKNWWKTIHQGNENDVGETSGTNHSPPTGYVVYQFSASTLSKTCIVYGY